MARGSTKKELIIPLPEHCFWVNNGPIVSDLKELHSVMKGEVTDEQYAHHVSAGRNDFADWVEYTLGDRECAQTMRKVKKKETMAGKIKTCLGKYKA